MRDAHGRFMEGASGNPGGRPLAVRQARDLIEALAPELVMELVGIVRDRTQPARTRVAAATALLDRRYGRPRQQAALEEGLILPLPDGELEPCPPAQLAAPAADDAPDADATNADAHPDAAPNGNEPAAQPVAAAAAAEPAAAATTDEAVKQPGRPDQPPARPSDQPAPSHLAGGGPWRFGMDWPPSSTHPRRPNPCSEAPPAPPGGAVVQPCSEVRR